MSEDIDPESTIPWPGFVDILSTVIIVFVFFMMMTSVIIFVLSEQAKKSAVANAQKEQSEAKEDSTKPAPETKLAPDVNNLLIEKEELQKEINKLTQLKNVLSESEDQKAARGEHTLTVTFGDMGATLVPATVDYIKAAMPYDGHITINALIPEGRDFGSIREIALNRALNVRNILLQSGVASDHIALRIIAPKESDEMNTIPYGNVTLVFEK